MTQKKQKIAMTNGHGEAELGYLKHIEEFEVTNVNPSIGADSRRRRRAASSPARSSRSTTRAATRSTRS